ncbi:sigma-70 family RNA polymerase sigma factor [Aeoliella sp.]|uniref:sigma-70 family RNA polymerase sigma factor n=1 Tax=Aeoliella sp. TaxID=2795800 RepID=UPI003CCB9B6C
MIEPTDKNDRTEQFVRLSAEHQRHVYLHILAQLPNRTDADDVMQETSLVLWRKFDDFQPGTNFRAWACRIAHFEVLKFLEKSGRTGAHFDSDVAKCIAQTMEDRADELDERRAVLDGCLKKLRDHDRELVRARYVDGMAARQLAHHSGRSVDAVYKTLQRIHRALLNCIERAIAREERV